MKELYDLASQIYGLRPWEMLNDSDLIMFRDGAGGEVCYCCVMGAAGEVYAVHAYIGPESFRLHRKIQSGAKIEPGEYFAVQRSVYVEFVPRKELLLRDRELLAWLDHPQGKGPASPIFRACRPGFHPWFVTAEEARTLAECLRAAIAVCQAVLDGKGKSFWKREDAFPMVSPAKQGETEDRIEIVKWTLPPEPPVVPVGLNEEMLKQVRGRDYPVRGIMELDCVLTGMPIGGKNERKSCAVFSLAVDAGSGMVYAPNATDSRTPAGEALAKAFLDAVRSTRALPAEVRVRTARIKDSIAPLKEAFGVTIRVSPKLPAADRAISSLLQFLH